MFRVDSQVLIDYLEKNGAPVPPSSNPAEFMLEAIGAGSRKRMGGGDWHEKWKRSPEFEQVKREIDELKANAIAVPDQESSNRGEYATSFMFQFRTVLQRSMFWFCSS